MKCVKHNTKLNLEYQDCKAKPLLRRAVRLKWLLAGAMPLAATSLIMSSTPAIAAHANSNGEAGFMGNIQVATEILLSDKNNGIDPPHRPGADPFFLKIGALTDLIDVGPNQYSDVFAFTNSITFTGIYTVTQTAAENL